MEGVFFLKKKKKEKRKKRATKRNKKMRTYLFVIVITLSNHIKSMHFIFEAELTYYRKNKKA